MIPATANIRKLHDLPFETSDLDVLLDQLDGAAHLSTIVLDSCRENPFRMRLGEGRGIAGSEGLAPVRAAVGTLIEYSTAPGTVAVDGTGPHSPFTTALLRQIEKPGVEVHQVFAEVRREVREATHGRQIPWEASAMEGAFYFLPPEPPVPATTIATNLPAAPASPGPGQSRSVADDAELLFWKTIADSRDVADFHEYLSKFPNGFYAGLARNRIRQLEGTPSVPPEPVARTAAPAATAPLSDRRETLDNDTLRTRLSAELTSMPDDLRKQRVAEYIASPPHRMFAMAPNRSGTYRNERWASTLGAEEHGLEKCQMHYGMPCQLLSVDQVFVGTPGQSDGTRRDMPRVRYAGTYDPAQIPAISETTRARSDIAGYGAAPGPKAMALSNGGSVFIATGASDQHLAEEKVLNDCDDDPTRAGADGPCFLYAVGNKIVLPDRRVDPMDAEAAYQRITAAAARVAPAIAAARIAEYSRQTEPKAIAIHIETGRMFWSYGTYDESRAVAEMLALEGCQQSFGSPCVLLAVGTELRAPDPAAAPKRDMPRLHASGAFAPETVPFVTVRGAPALRTYASLPGAKAIAIRAVRTRFEIVSGAASAAEAEKKALAACNETGSDLAFPCFVYASGDRIVLPARRTEPGP
jgi:hypothetical protein